MSLLAKLLRTLRQRNEAPPIRARIGGQPIFRVFVSSTFLDMKPERNALRDQVFPFLERYCGERGARFQAVDLRAGISREAGEKQLTLKICLDELRRCQRVTPRPNFIALLGDRYGWRPLPARIDAAEFEALLKRAPDGKAAKRMKRWYRLDSNAVPNERVLLSRHGASRRWRLIEDRLHDDLMAAATRHFGKNSPELERYACSATHHEVNHGLFTSGDPQTHVLCFLRSIVGDIPAEKADQYFDFRTAQRDREAWQRQKDLKKRVENFLDAPNIWERSLSWQDLNKGVHLQELVERTRKHLCRVIDEELARLRTAAPPGVAETTAHNAFAKERAEVFVGRTDALGRIASYLQDGSDTPLVVFGASGGGKSAVMANASRLAAKANARVVARFIGATPASTIAADLVADIAQELGAKAGQAKPRAAPQALLAAIGQPRDKRPLAIFIDAIDQLEGDSASIGLGWIPRRLPSGLKLVLSVTQEADAFRALQALIPREQFVNLGPLPRPEAAELLAVWLATAGDVSFSAGSAKGLRRARTLTTKQSQHVLAQFEASGGTPLYLKLAFEEARGWRSFDEIPGLGAAGRGLADSVTGMIADLFTRLSLPQFHGRELTRHALGYFASARHGLQEEEMLLALSNREVLGEFDARWPETASDIASSVAKDGRHSRSIPHLIWSRLYADLEPYLSERSSDDTYVLRFFHRQFEEAARAAYLSGRDRVRRHRRLAACFLRRKRSKSAAPATTPTSLRNLSELPYQLTRAGAKTTLLRVLGDLSFVEAKCRSGLFFDLIRDIERASAVFSAESKVGGRLSSLKQLLQSAGHEIAARPDLSLQALHNVARWAGAAEANSWIKPAASSLSLRGPWLAAEGRLPSALRSTIVNFGEEASVQAMSANGMWLALYPGGDEVLIRDLATGALVDARPIPSEARHRIRAISIEYNGRLAWLADAHAASESSKTRMRVRRDDNILRWSPDGELLVVRADGALTAWRPDQNTTRVVVETLPAPAIAVDVSAAGDTVLAVAGPSQPLQRIAIARRTDGGWTSSTIPFTGPLVVDAKLNSDGNAVLLACQDFSLKYLDIVSGEARELFYERLKSPVVRGSPVGCALCSTAQGVRAYVATRTGDLALWSPDNGQLAALPSYGHRLETKPLVLLQARHSDGTAFLSTAREGWFLDGGATVHAPSGHAAEVDDCCITQSDRIVTVSYQDRSVRWWETVGLTQVHVEATSAHLGPRRIRADRAGDTVIVGTMYGTVARLSPSQPQEDVVARQVFKSAVSGLLVTGPSSGLALSDRFGIVSFSLQKPEEYRLLQHETEGKSLERIVPLGQTASFCALRREETGRGPVWIVSVFDQQRNELIVRRSERPSHCVACASDGSSLAIADFEKVTLFRPTPRGWQESAARVAEVGLVEFFGAGPWLAVALGTEWIEVWDIDNALTTISAIHLGREATSMSTRIDRLAVGCRTGEVISLRLRTGARAGGVAGA